MSAGTSRSPARQRAIRLLLAFFAVASLIGVMAPGAFAASGFPSGLGEVTPAAEAPTINPVEDRTGTAKKPIVPIVITGTNLFKVTPAPGLPGSLSLKPVTGHEESEWEISGTPEAALPTTEFTLNTENSEGAPGPTASFHLTINEAGPSIVNPGDQATPVGSGVSLPISGERLFELTPVKPLPTGLQLQKETESAWKVEGVPTTPGVYSVQLEAKSKEGGPVFVEFNWTIQAQPAPPPPGAPTATDLPSISPGVVFSAARATCRSASWSGGTVTTQWLLDGAPITGATAGTFVPPRSYDGHALACRQTASANGASTTLTSAARMVHEQPPQPSWPISPASAHCTSAICMQQGAGPGAVGQAYPQEGAWWGSQQVRCVSAPWTSAVGSSAQPAVRALAEAHTVWIALQRVTSSGAVTVAGQEIGALGTARDLLDGGSTPFGGSIVAPFGAQTFAAGELWSTRFPGSVGRPDWFAAGGGLLAYGVAGAPGVARSFQLTYTLGAADLGARLRCVAGADDGPPGAPTSASFVSPEYALAGSAACGPERLGSASLPQPALVWDGEAPCLDAPSSLAGLGASPRDVAVKGGRVAVALGCGARHRCRGTLALTAVVGHGRETLGKAKARVGAGALRVIALRLSARGKHAVKAAGGAGLSASLELTSRRHGSRVASVKLIAQG